MAFNFTRGLPESLELELDRDNPITRDCDFLGVPRSDGRALDLVRGLRMSTRGEVNKTPQGVALNVSTATNAETSHLNYTAAPFTVWVFCYIANSASNYYTLLSRTRYGSESDNEGFGLETRNTNVFRLMINRDNGAANYELNGSAYTTGFYQVAGSSDGVTKRIYGQGVQANSSTGGNLAPVSNTTSGLSFGGFNANAGNGVLIGGIWRRALTAAEIYSLYWNPFQMVRQKRNYSRLWVSGIALPGSGSAAFTATAATMAATGTVITPATATAAFTATAATMAASGTVVNPAAATSGNLMLLGIG